MTLCRSITHPIYIKARQWSNERSSAVFIEGLISFFYLKKHSLVLSAWLCWLFLPRGTSFPRSRILGPSAFCIWCYCYQSKCLSARHHLMTGFSDSNSDPLKAGSDYLQTLSFHHRCLHLKREELKHCIPSTVQISLHWNQCFGATNVAVTLADSQSILTYYIPYTAGLQPPNKLVKSICCSGLLTFHEK